MKNAIDIVSNLLELAELFRKSPGGYSTKQVAEKFHVSQDTALRYIYRLSTSGLVPLVKKGKYWSRLQGHRPD